MSKSFQLGEAVRISIQKDPPAGVSLGTLRSLCKVTKKEEEDNHSSDLRGVPIPHAKYEGRPCEVELVGKTAGRLRTHQRVIRQVERELSHIRVLPVAAAPA